MPRPANKQNVIADLYLRLSDLRLTDLNEDNESKGLVEHERLLRRHVRALGWTVGEVIHENDMSNGRPKPASAYKRKRVVQPDGTSTLRVIRPGFQKLLSRLRNGHAQAVVAVDLDRAVRDPRDLEDLIDVVEEHRLNARSLSGSLQFTDGGTDGEITLARVMVTMGNKSSRDTARRVSAARERQAMNGVYGGGRRPYGFAADGITIDPDEAAVIVAATQDLLGGVPLRSITSDMQQRAVPTSHGGPWAATALRDILLRPRNAGMMVHQGKVVGKAPWEPIVPEDVWLAVVDVLNDPTRRTSPGPAPKYLGSGIYLCTCGEPLYAMRSRKDRAPAYRCASAIKGRNPEAKAGHVTRNVERVDGVVRDWIIAKAEQAAISDMLGALPDAGIDVKAIRARLAVLDAKKKRLVVMNVADDIDDAQLAEGTRVINAERSTLIEKLASQGYHSPFAALVDADDATASWDSLSLGAQRAIIAETAIVTILAAGPGARFHPSQVKIEPRP